MAVGNLQCDFHVVSAQIKIPSNTQFFFRTYKLKAFIHVPMDNINL